MACLVVALWFSGGWAWAHKIKVFAAAEGKTISGYAYFPGGGRPKNVKVEVFDPRGRKLGETTTNAKGEFAFQAKVKCDHKLVVDTGDGHRATFVVEAAELPDSLPAPAPATGAPKAKPPEARPAPAGQQARPDAAAAPSMSQSDLEELVGRVVSRYVRPLREQLDRYEEKRRVHDILGGIGYILGLAGITFYFLGSARRRARHPPPE